MNPADLCELDDVTETGRAWIAVLRADLAVSHALVDEWEPAPLPHLRRLPSFPAGDVPVTACQIASGSPDRWATSVRRDLRLATVYAVVLAPLPLLLARGGWT